MSLFQKTVITKYLNTQNKESISIKWESYKFHFLNPKVQEEIKSLKEEQYQGEFLEDLFVKILGYTKPASSSETPYNLTTEYKNVKDSKKADGAIIIDAKVKAVIELKGTNTTDLGKIEVQAFGYKNNQPECVYVITSNFEKLRFYIDNAIEHLEFNLFTLTQEEFSLLYLCLGYENIANDIAKKIKEESLSEEDVITKKLYKDYSIFKRELYQSLVALNPAYEPLELFKISQKLLDRFLFLLFGEDRNLLPPNSIKLILSQWNQLRELDEYTPLYDRFRKYFGYLNTGYKGKQYDVFAYNGGLFKPDEILDSITIDDDLLYKYTLKLSEYDFASEVDVNILGHIFENSLNELDEIKAQLEGAVIDKSKTKRKKDGVFYTPKYITKYIVENTVGKLCEEKKAEIVIIEEDYFTDKKRQKKTIKGLVDKLEAYRKWLLQVTIIDPACGSGAFLNEALNFLIAEHTYVDELQAKLFGDAMVLSDVEKSILENNLFGVDLNEESVEIAKLSLWLRTAQPNRKLNDLSSNIKCGNSLIDDPEIAGDKAFYWQNEFPKVFEKGGFDVVIGNPPYVNMNTFPKAIHNYFEIKYDSIHTGYNDLMYYFLYKGLNIINNNGLFGMITSNYFIGNEYAKNLRRFLSNHVTEIINFENYHVFKDANVHTAIILAEKKPVLDLVLFQTYSLNHQLNEIILNSDIYKKSNISRLNLVDKWIIADNLYLKLIEKLNKNKTLLGEIAEIAKGSETGKNEIFTLNNEDIVKFNIEKDVMKKCIKNSNIDSYVISFEDKYIIYADNNFSEDKFPNAYKYLESNKELLLDRRGPKTGEYEWWRLHRPSIKEIFDSNEKILVPYRADKNRFGYDNKQYFNNGGDIRAIKIINDDFNTKYVIGLLNSTLINWLYGYIGKPKGNSREYFNIPLSLIPIHKTKSEIQNYLIEKVDNIILKKERFQDNVQKFQRTIQRKFELEDLPKKLQNWYLLTYPEFIKELAKKKVKLSLSQEAEWEDYFMQESKKALELKSQIDATDKAIDTVVYDLYGLTEEEIEIVENS
jgi:hypothetical protein